MKLADVIATEADWYTGRRAVKLGLMDGIATEAEAWGALEGTSGKRPDPNTLEDNMNSTALRGHPFPDGRRRTRHKPECETEPDDQDDALSIPKMMEEEEMADTTNTTDTEQPESGQNASDATARNQAVATSENVKGREALALSMLADDDFADMSVAAMIKVLGNTNKADARGR